MGGGFGDLLRRHRRAAQLTQEDLAGRSGLSVEAISALERGWRRAPRRDTVALLAGALDLSPEDRRDLAAAARRLPAPAARDQDALPVPPTPLVDRDRELAAAVSALRSGDRLLTLTGPGGSGKTRLALAVAWELAPELSGPAVFVDLGAVADPDQVAHALRQALRLHDAPGRSAADRVVDHLAQRRALLLLDNLEHLLPAAATLAATLLERCPDLRLVATSRVPLRIRGERVTSVPPLPVPARGRRLVTSEAARVPAVELFVGKAVAAGSGFTLTDENMETVAEICRRLDGLPLALELAAPWLRLLTPQDLLARLDEQASMLAGGPDLPERQRTLQRTLEWSHDLLGPDERTLFRRLSVFSAGFELADVEAVCGDGLPDGALLASLAALVDASLVVRSQAVDGGTELRLLETIRRHAAELLAAGGEEDGVRARHAGHYRALVEEAQPSEWRPPETDWLRRLEGAHAELRGALRWFERHDQAGWTAMVTSLGWFWLTHGHLDEGRAWLCRLLDTGAPTATDRRRALYQLARLIYWQGEYALATDLAGRSAALARDLDDTAGAGWALNLIAYVRGYAGEHAAARAALEEVLATAVEDDLRLDSLIGLGDLLLQAGQIVDAREFLERAVRLSGGREAHWQVGRIRLLLGVTCYLEGDDVSASRLLAESLSLLAEVANWYGLAGALDVISGVVLRAGDAENALRLVSAAAVLREVIGAPLSASWQAILDEVVIRPARVALPPARAEAAWAEGGRLSMDDAIDHALRVLGLTGRGGGA
jgi:predicted ATPase/DNA-binding XRE family transcriptional regulator